MCNPPFYASDADLLTSAAEKSRPPHSACTGAEVEMVTPGGEVAFVSRMIEESLVMKERVQWYSSMLGKLSSVNTVTEGLKEKGVDNWAVKEFVQGEKTRRWGVAWSWGDLRPSMVGKRQIIHNGGSRLILHRRSLGAFVTFRNIFYHFRPSTPSPFQKLLSMLSQHVSMRQ